MLEGDIKGCFDNISHEWLMENVPMDKAVMAQFLKAGFMEQGEWRETEAGTPRGGIISPIYCNLALDGMERLLDNHFTLGGTGRRDRRKAGRSKVHLARYADDFVVTAASPTSWAGTSASTKGSSSPSRRRSPWTPSSRRPAGQSSSTERACRGTAS